MDVVFYDQTGRITHTPRATGQTSKALEAALKALANPDWRLRKIARDHRHGLAERLLRRVLAGEITLDTWLAADGRPHTARVVGRYLLRMTWVQQLTEEAA